MVALQLRVPMTIRSFQAIDEPAVIELWRRCNLTRAWNDPKKDIARKLKVRPDLFLVAEEEGAIVGTAMCGYEGHRGWISYLGVCPDHQRKGIGRALMAEAERRLRAEGCPKINLQVRTSNREVVAFYKAIGFAMDDVVSLGKRLEAD
jgi:ribosomal protein S18 acetylase RimI-like enzyme